MANRQWVPPPNWPRPPHAGWEPPADWKPDPAWGPAPEWWNFYPEITATRPRRNWGKLTAAAITVLAAVGIVIGLVLTAAGGHSRTRHYDPTALDGQIELHYQQRGFAGIVVNCPAGEPVKAQTVFLCSLSHAKPFSYVQVTVLNSAGDIDFQAIQ